MADILNKAGTNVGNGYKLIGASPLDVRLVVADIDERDSIVTANGCYPGLEVWVESEGKQYCAIPKDNTYEWKETSLIEDIPKHAITGTGTKDYVPIFTDPMKLGNSIISQNTAGTKVTVSGPTTIIGDDTESTDQPSTLKVLATNAAASDSGWKGRLVVGAQNKTFLLGTFRGKCGLGAHSWTNASANTGADWEDVYINPDGTANVYLGGYNWITGSGVMKIANVESKNTARGLASINRGTYASPSWKEIAVKEDISDKTITLAAGNGLTDGGDFTLNQASDETITFNVGAGEGITVNADNVAHSVPTGASAASYGPSDGGEQTAKGTLDIIVPQITTDKFGHITSVSNKTFKVTDSDTTYSAGTGLTLTNTTFSLKNTSVNVSCQQGNLIHHCIATGFTKATTQGNYIVLELYSRAGESIRINISSNDSTYTAYAVRITNTYGKIKAVYFNSTDGKLYVTTDNYANNLGCKVTACSEDLATPVMTTVATIPSGAASITITSDLTGSGSNNYLAKFNGNNTITSGPALTGDGTKYLNDKGEWAAISIPEVDLSVYVTLNGADIITGNKTFTGYVVTSNNKFEIKATGNTDDSWIKLTNASDDGYYAFGIRRPYDIYGLQLKIKAAGKTESEAEYYDIWNAHNDGAGSGLDADKLDGQEGSYYLDYKNFTNTPTIPTIPTVNDATLTMNTSGTGLSGSQTFTSNQSSAATFTVTIDSSAAGDRAANKVVLAKAAGQIDSDKFTITSSGATKATWQYNSSTDCVELVW